MFWSDACVTEIGRILRQINISGFRGVDIQDCVLDVAEIKSHPPDAYGLISHHKATYMGNVLKWGTATVNDDKKNGIRHNRSKRRAVSLSEIREERD